MLWRKDWSSVFGALASSRNLVQRFMRKAAMTVNMQI
jgi:hypothetical protein